MLPNRMQLSRSTEEHLKKLKSYTGVTPNITARIAFFRSIESEFRYDTKIEYKTDGSLTLDNITWLGRTKEITELLLNQNYPSLEGKQLQQAWAAHVEHGVATLRNHKSLAEMMGKV